MGKTGMKTLIGCGLVASTLALAAIPSAPARAAEAREQLRATVRQGGEGQDRRLGARLARRARVRMDARDEERISTITASSSKCATPISNPTCSFRR